jgi:ParB-like chromosome segregation protein Spo0J
MQSRFMKSVKLSDKISYVNPKELKPNPLNATFFQSNNADMEKLKADIQARGVLVPLVVKKDGTVLAGHTRLALAKELGLQSVPVQYSEKELSNEEERKFIVNDNLLRRQLSGEERMNLYRVLYPGVDSLLSEEKSNGRPKKGELTLKQIAEETGQKENTVKQQFKRARQEAKGVKKGYTVPISKKSKNIDSPAQAALKVKEALTTIEQALDSLTDTDRNTYRKKMEKLTDKMKSYVII